MLASKTKTKTTEWFCVPLVVQENRGHAESNFWTSVEVTENKDFALRIFDSACIDYDLLLGVVGKKSLFFYVINFESLDHDDFWQFNGVGRMDAKTKFSLIWLLASKCRTQKDNSEDHGPLVPLTVTRRYHLKSFPFECCFRDDNQGYMAFNFCLQTKDSNFDMFAKATLIAFDKQEYAHQVARQAHSTYSLRCVVPAWN